MPAALPFIVGFLLKGYGIWQFIAVLATSLVVNNYEQNKARRRARDAYNSQLKDRLEMTATADGARSRVYGKVRNVDGVLFKATHGTHSEFYTLVVALAGHEVEGIDQVYFNDLAVTLDADGYVQTAPYARTDLVSSVATLTVDAGGNGSVTLPGVLVPNSISASQNIFISDEPTRVVPFSLSGNTVSVSGLQYTFPVDVAYQSSVTTSYARVRKRLGRDTQDISSEIAALVPNLITVGAHRFAGIALLITTLEFNTDAFPTGVPSMSAVMRGKKVWDPRNGVTGWTHPTAPAGPHPGENPALCALDWALYERGGGLEVSETVLQGFIDAANASDIATTFNTRTTRIPLPTVNIASWRYMCGTVAKLDVSADDTFNSIVSAMAGSYGWSGGKLRVRAGAWRAPVTTITEDWVSDAGAISVQSETAPQDTYNVVRASISDATRAYVVLPMPEVRAEEYIEADGEELPLEIEMGSVTWPYRAADVAEVNLLESRQALTLMLPLKFHAFQLELFDIVNVTLPHYGWVAKEFEVLGWSFTLDGGVACALKEVAATSYDVNTLFTLDDMADNTELPTPWIVATPQGLTVTSIAELDADKQLTTRTIALWSPVLERQVVQSGKIEIQWASLAALPVINTLQWVNDAGELLTWVSNSGAVLLWSGINATSVETVGWVNNAGDAVAWENDFSSLAQWVRAQIALLTEGDWNKREEPGSSITTTIVGLRSGFVYVFRIRAVNSLRVRSAWSTQAVILIPSVPSTTVSWNDLTDVSVSTDQIEPGAVAEVLVAKVESDTLVAPANPFAPAFTNSHDRVLAPLAYTNNTSGAVVVEISISSRRQLVLGAGFTGEIRALDFIRVIVNGIISQEPFTPVGYFDAGPTSTPSQTIQWTETVIWTVNLVAGDVLTVESYYRIFPFNVAAGSVTMNTFNLTHRMTVIKR